MVKTRKAAKLNLASETIRRLSDGQLGGINGGAIATLQCSNSGRPTCALACSSSETSAYGSCPSEEVC